MASNNNNNNNDSSKWLTLAIIGAGIYFLGDIKKITAPLAETAGSALNMANGLVNATGEFLGIKDSDIKVKAMQYYQKAKTLAFYNPVNGGKGYGKFQKDDKIIMYTEYTRKDIVDKIWKSLNNGLFDTNDLAVLVGVINSIPDKTKFCQIVKEFFIQKGKDLLTYLYDELDSKDFILLIDSINRKPDNTILK